ncbi:hypothetical protein T310_9218, partial [Rasamsonia emersonii CBS 393.64]
EFRCFRRRCLLRDPGVLYTRVRSVTGSLVSPTQRKQIFGLWRSEPTRTDAIAWRRAIVSSSSCGHSCLFAWGATASVAECFRDGPGRVGGPSITSQNVITALIAAIRR